MLNKLISFCIFVFQKMENRMKWSPLWLCRCTSGAGDAWPTQRRRFSNISGLDPREAGSIAPDMTQSQCPQTLPNVPGTNGEGPLLAENHQSTGESPRQGPALPGHGFSRLIPLNDLPQKTSPHQHSPTLCSPRSLHLLAPQLLFLAAKAV